MQCYASRQPEEINHATAGTIRSMKTAIWIGITIGGTVGSWLGAMPDHGNWFGGWSILGSLIGSLVGIWAAYKIAKNYL